MITASSTSLRVNRTDHSLEIRRSDSESALVTQHAAPDQRPFLHPIRAPDGCGILTENEPPHHRWQHGLYVGLNDINGIGFWTEGLRGDPNDGTFHPRELSSEVCAESVRWTVRTQWRSPPAPIQPVPASAPMIQETQAWTLRDHRETFTLDLEWTLRAEMDLTFGKYAYGGLFLRMPFKEGVDARGLNSEGLPGTEGEGKRARWVAVSMRIGGRTTPAGMAIMDHPSNPEHPVPWRIDGQFGIGPSRCIAGAWNLKRGESATFRHRVLVLCGVIGREEIEASYAQYSR